MCRYFAPVIQATKGRLMKLATPRDAEFGLRSAPVEVCNLILLLARYVGGGGRLTSNDTAEFLYPELFQSIGTIGHEMMCAAQSLDRPLGEAEYEMMDRFVSPDGHRLAAVRPGGRRNGRAGERPAGHPLAPGDGPGRHPGGQRGHRRPVRPVLQQDEGAGDQAAADRVRGRGDPETSSAECTRRSASRPARSRPCSSPGPAGTGGGWSTATRWRRRSSGRRPATGRTSSSPTRPGKESIARLPPGLRPGRHARRGRRVRAAARRAAVREAGGPGADRVPRAVPGPGGPGRPDVGRATSAGNCRRR